MKKFLALMALIVSLAAVPAAAQQLMGDYTLAAGATFRGPTIDVSSGPFFGTQYYLLTFTPTNGSSLTTCGVSVDSFLNNQWTVGGAVPGQVCTAAGSYQSSSSVAALSVRLNATLTGNGNFRVQLYGFIAQPVSGTTPFNGVPTGSCGATQSAVDTTTGTYYSCNSGTWLKVGPGAAGSASFSTLTGGTNAGQALVVGAGSSLTASGGTIVATSAPYSGLTGFPANCAANTVQIGVGLSNVCASLTTGYLPTLTAGSNGLANSATTDTTNAGNITSGTLSAGRLPTSAVQNNQSNTYSTGVQDFSSASTFRPKFGLVASLPATCSVGDVYEATNATAGQNWYFCTSTNTWTQQLNSGTFNLTVNGGSALTSPVNFQNGGAFNGLTINFSNPTGSNVQATLSGTLANTGLANSSIIVTTAGPLSGAGTIALGGTLSLGCSTCAVTSGDLSQFSSTTSAQLASVISNETGSGQLVFGTSPMLVTPSIGAATGTSLQLSSLSGSGVQCLQTDNLGNITATGTGACGSGGGSGLSGMTAGQIPVAATPTTVTSSIATSGSGSVARTTSPTFVTPVLGTPTSVTLTNGTGLPISTGVSGLGTGVATFLATPSSANLASAITDETGTGAAVFATSPTLVTPTLGAAIATTINKVTITQPATSATLTVANGKTLTASNTLTFTGTDSSSVAFGTGGTVTYTSNNLSVFAATTSAQLAGVLSDEIGSGKAVFATALQGTDGNLLTAGTISGTSVSLCTDASGGATTVSCPTPLSNPMSAIGQMIGGGTSGAPTSIAAGLTGQTIVATNGATPAFSSPGLGQGNGGAAVSTTPYSVKCDSSTAMLDRATLLILQSGASVVNIPDPSTSGCGGNYYFAILDDGAGNVTVNRGTSAVFNIADGNSNADSQTSFTMANGQYATLNSPDNSNWTVRKTVSCGSSCALTSGNLSQFASTTSAQLAGVISDETGSGALVFGTSPTLVTPTLGAATATSINKMAITAPATSSTLEVANGKTFTVSNTLTLTGTDSSSIAFGSGGTVAYTANNLSVFASTTSAQLAGVLSDETGTGAAVFATSPTLVTPVLGTPTSVTLTNATGLPISTGVSGLGTGVATFLGTPSSANLRAAVTDETGTGALFFAGGNAGTPSAINLTNGTALPIGGINATGTPSSSNFLRGDGTWNTPAGGGNVSNSGTPTSGQAAEWVSATAIQGVGTAGGGTQYIKATITSPAEGDVLTFDATPKVVNLKPGISVDAQSSATPSVSDPTDRAALLETTNGTTSTATSVPSAASLGSNFPFVTCNLGSVINTLTPTTSTVNGNATQKLVGKVSGHNPECAFWWSDNTNYFSGEILPTDANGLLADEGLPNTGVSAGSCGDATHSCSITVDAKGRLTAQSNNVITGGGSGLSGMTAGQVPIAATASTITSSKALAGSGTGIVTGPTTSVSTDLVSYTGTAGQTQDSGILSTNLTQTTATPAANQICVYGSTAKTCTPTTTLPTAAEPAHTGDVTNSSGSLALTIAANAVTGAKMANNTVTATQLAAQYSKGSCTEVWSGSGTASALQSGDDAISNNTCYNDSGVTRTITAVKCRSNVASNTTTVNPTFGSAGTGTTILSGALTCGSSFAYSSTGTVTNASWTTGSGIDPAMGGTLTGASIAMIVEYTY